MATNPPPMTVIMTPEDPAAEAGKARSAQKFRQALIWGVVGCVLLIGSAVQRKAREAAYAAEAVVLQECPFPLERIPRTLKNWKSVDNDQKLDNQTFRITGGKEYVIRKYTDETTGISLIVLVLFGPLEPVIPHTPEVCYPANGFVWADDTLSRSISFVDEDNASADVYPPARFKSALFRKGIQLESVYHSFRVEGRWTPDVAAERKPSRRNMGVFKLQVQRLVAPEEQRDRTTLSDPIEDFLKEIVPAIEKELSEAGIKDVTKIPAPPVAEKAIQPEAK